MSRTVVVVILLCSFVASGGQAETRTGVSARVGAILPLTGVSADYGEAIRNSIELARSDRPDLLSGVEFIYEDASYDPKQAVTAFQKLTTRDRVNLVYVWGVAFCKVVAPLAEAARIPMVGQCIDPETGRGRSYVVRFMNYTDQYLRATAKFLAAKGYRRLSVILTENAYLEEMLAALNRTLEAGQAVTVVQRFPSAEMDFRAVISRIRQSDAQAVGVFLSAGQISAFYKQMREQHLSIPSFGTNFFESLSEVEAAAGAMEGAVFANNDVRPEYLERYGKRFGRITQIGFGALAYEFTLTLGRVLSNEDTNRSSEQLLRAIAEHPSERGIAAGPYAYKFEPAAGKFFEFPVVIKRIQGKTFTAVE